MKKNYPINMKIPGAHLRMVSKESKNFQKNPCTHFLNKIVSTEGIESLRAPNYNYIVITDTIHRNGQVIRPGFDLRLSFPALINTSSEQILVSKLRV